MITAEHLEAWRGQPVLDPDGEQLGKLEEVYLDARNEEPVLIAVKSGLLGRQHSLIPVNDATVGPDFVRVAHGQATVEQAGGSDDAPDQAQLQTLGSVYGLRFADGLELHSASDLEARRAAAEEARRHAAELDAQAREKEAERDAAHERAQGAGDDAEQAQRDAEQARQAAEEARRQAERHGEQPGAQP